VNAERFLAHNRALRALLEQVRRFAATDSNVFAVLEALASKSADALAHRPTLDEVERRYSPRP
jgi:hypothetical protein